MCKIPGGLVITPGHPILYNGKWVYPKEIVKSNMIECDSFYNLIV